MSATELPSLQLQSSLKFFAQYLAGLYRLPTFDSVNAAEEEAQKRLDTGLKELDSRERQIALMMQQIVEIYSRDRQMQITGRNPYCTMIEMDEAQMK